MPPPLKNSEASLGGEATQKLTNCAKSNVAKGFLQAAAILTQLRRRGVFCAIFAISFDEELEKTREQIEALLREKAIERRRKPIASWTHEARRLAREFADTGNWKCFRVLLVHVVAMKQRLKGDLA